MNCLVKVVTGHLPDNAPSTTLQICYLEYVNKRNYCKPVMKRNFKLNMATLRNLYEAAIDRRMSKAKTSSTEHEIWRFGIFKRILDNSSPYTSSNPNELTIYEWRLQSSVDEAFIFNKIQFDAVTVIIENQMQHWFGIKKSSDPVYTYHRSKKRPRPLLSVECCELPRSPIVLAASDPDYMCKCDKCGNCNQIILPMETYILKKVCPNDRKELEVESAHECMELLTPKKFCFKNLLKNISFDHKL